MAASATVNQIVVYEDAGATCMARVYGNAATAITQATISSITCAVYDLTTGSSVVTPSVVVATSVFDTLQTDARWTADATGYNFRYDLPATAFPTGDRRYRIEFVFTPTSGAVFVVLFEADAIALYGS